MKSQVRAPPAQYVAPSMYMPPYCYPPATYYSIDVECVAVGTDHNSRAIGQIALLDEYEQVLLNVFVKPEQAVVSYLTPLTGLTSQMLNANGIPLSRALHMLRSSLPSHAVLVGQNISKDVQWLGLKEGKDFASMIDLSGLYRIWNKQYNTYSVFSQDHLARVLLGWPTEGAQHDAALDALKSIKLFKLHVQYSSDPAQWKAAQDILLKVPPEPSFAKRNPVFEGVCMGHRKACTCGAPFLG